MSEPVTWGAVLAIFGFIVAGVVALGVIGFILSVIAEGYKH